MKTVLFLTQTAHPIGGLQNWLEQMDHGLPAHGWNVAVGLAWGRSFHSPQSFLRYHPLQNPVWLDGRTGTETGRRLAIEKAIRSVKPDVVAPLNLFATFPVVHRLKQDGRRPYLLYASHELSPLLTCDARAYADWIDQGVAVSPLLTTVLTQVVGLPAERACYIPYGVGHATAPRVPRSPGAPLEIGYVGRLDPMKRPLDLVPLCEELERLGVPYRLRIFGRGSLAGALREGLCSRIASGVVRWRKRSRSRSSTGTCIRAGISRCCSRSMPKGCRSHRWRRWPMG